MLNRNPSGSVRLGAVKLVELDSLPPSPPVRVPAHSGHTDAGPVPDRSRMSLDRFGGRGETGLDRLRWKSLATW